MTAGREVEWFRRFPNGGTVYSVDFPPPDRPTGGATVFVDPTRSGNPYAGVEDADARPVATVELPVFEETDDAER